MGRAGPVAALESMDKAIAQKGNIRRRSQEGAAATDEALTGLLGCVCLAHRRYLHHAVVRARHHGAVQKWDLHLHQRIH